MNDDEISAWAQAHAKDLLPKQELARLDGWTIRKTTAEEEAASGMKVMWDKSGEEKLEETS